MSKKTKAPAFNKKSGWYQNKIIGKPLGTGKKHPKDASNIFPSKLNNIEEDENNT